MTVLRTPDKQFENLPGFTFDPNYSEVPDERLGSLRIHHVDEGPADGPVVLCMHGGLSPHLESLQDVRDIPRPTGVPSEGLLCDLLWSDPEQGVEGWGENDRGISLTFGEPELTKACRRLGMQLVVRAHQAL